jgi:hypothetical protein
MRPLLLVLVLLGSSCQRDSSRPPVAGPQHQPQNAAECAQCKGQWGIHGMAQVETCLCRTRDAGKECRDGLDCEGECEVKDGRTEVTDPGPPPRGYFLGRCTEFDRVFGCRKLLMDGTHARGPVPLDEPLGELCID